jgi:hypothetical protein
MKHTINIIVFFLLSLNSFGTAQIPDIIIYKGDTLSLFDCPLESYPNKELLNPKGLFGSRGCFFTACWRNYIATWVIEDDKLYLKEIRNGCYPTEMKGVSVSYKSGVNKDSIGCEYADLNTLFPDKYKNGKVLADWVNGQMYSPRGKLMYYIHDGFQSIYENELEFSFKNGLLVNIREFDNSKTKKSKYKEDEKLLIKFIKENIDYTEIPNPNEKAKVFITIVSATDEGKIDSVRILRGSDKFRNTEAIRVVKSIPEWDVLYRHGKRFSMGWTIPIIFGTETK